MTTPDNRSAALVSRLDQCRADIMACDGGNESPQCALLREASVAIDRANRIMERAAPWIAVQLIHTPSEKGQAIRNSMIAFLESTGVRT